MIAANKNLLKANLTQGVLGIQTNLISLYASNLSAIATQSALIGGFAFTAVIGQQALDSRTHLTLGIQSFRMVNFMIYNFYIDFDLTRFY